MSVSLKVSVKNGYGSKFRGEQDILRQLNGFVRGPVVSMTFFGEIDQILSAFNVDDLRAIVGIVLRYRTLFRVCLNRNPGKYKACDQAYSQTFSDKVFVIFCFISQFDRF